MSEGPLRRSFVSRRFALNLDDPNGGRTLGGVVGMLDGGAIKGDVIEQRVGAMSRAVKTIGNPVFEPFTAQIGMAISPMLTNWIADSFAGRYTRMSGSVERLNTDSY